LLVCLFVACLLVCLFVCLLACLLACLFVCLLGIFFSAGFSQSVPLKIGSKGKLWSLLYQAYRYHWSHFGNEEEDDTGGEAFSWCGVPSTLLTDFDAVFDPSPHFGKLSDQLPTLEQSRVSDFAKILSAFILGSHHHPRFAMNYTSGEFLDSLHLGGTWCKFIRNFHEVVSSYISRQYIGMGPYVFGFVEVASVSFVIIAVVCLNSVGHYKMVYPSSEQTDAEDLLTETEGEGDSEEDTTDNEDNPSSSSPHHHHALKPREVLPGHTILLVHMIFMGVAVIVDTIFAFGMLTLSLFALFTIHFHRFYINVIAGFVCCLLCANFLSRDIIIIASTFSVWKGGAGDLWFAALILMYSLHVVLLLFYGYDYRFQLERLKRHV